MLSDSGLPLTVKYGSACRSAVILGGRSESREQTTLKQGEHMTQTDQQVDKVKTVRDYIAHTTGTEHHWGHPLMRSFRYTDGVKFIADTCGAHWLIDLIASHQLKPKVRRERFQVWVLKPETFRKDGELVQGWVAEAWTDTPGESKRIVRQTLEYTDFPAELMPFTLWVESGVLLLPAEH